MRYTRYTKDKKYIIFTNCTKDMRKYKTNKKYLSQYDFYNGVKSQHLIRNLFLWYNNKKIRKLALAVCSC